MLPSRRAWVETPIRGASAVPSVSVGDGGGGLRRSRSRQWRVGGWSVSDDGAVGGGGAAGRQQPPGGCGSCGGYRRAGQEGAVEPTDWWAAGQGVAGDTGGGDR